MLRYVICYASSVLFFLLAIRCYLDWTDKKGRALLAAWVSFAVIAAAAGVVAFEDEKSLGIHPEITSQSAK